VTCQLLRGVSDGCYTVTVKQVNVRGVSAETYERLRQAAFAARSTIPAVARAWLDKYEPDVTVTVQQQAAQAAESERVMGKVADRLLDIVFWTWKPTEYQREIEALNANGKRLAAIAKDCLLDTETRESARAEFLLNWASIIRIGQQHAYLKDNPDIDMLADRARRDLEELATRWADMTDDERDQALDGVLALWAEVERLMPAWHR
jgi:hypothetical protein